MAERITEKDRYLFGKAKKTWNNSQQLRERVERLLSEDPRTVNPNNVARLETDFNVDSINRRHGLQIERGRLIVRQESKNLEVQSTFFHKESHKPPEIVVLRYSQEKAVTENCQITRSGGRVSLTKVKDTDQYNVTFSEGAHGGFFNKEEIIEKVAQGVANFYLIIGAIIRPDTP